MRDRHPFIREKSEGFNVNKMAKSRRKSSTPHRKKYSPPGVPTRVGRAGLKLRSGTLSRRYHTEPDKYPVTEGMRETYNRVINEIQLEKARENGLTRKQMDAFISRLINYGHQSHLVDARGNSILYTNPETKMLEIKGVKILPEEKRSRNLQPIKNRIQTWKKARRVMQDLQQRFPGIEYSSEQVKKLHLESVPELTFFRLSPEKRGKLKKDFEVQRQIERNERHEIEKFSRKNQKY